MSPYFPSGTIIASDRNSGLYVYRVQHNYGIVRVKVVDAASPIVYGYSEAPAIYSFDGPIFNVSNLAGGRGGRRRGPDDRQRPTGRGTADDPDRPTGRIFADPSGAEEIEFEVASHPSLPLRALAKVASGGELSRISLAIQMVAAKASPVWASPA